MDDSSYIVSYFHTAELMLAASQTADCPEVCPGGKDCQVVAGALQCLLTTLWTKDAGSVAVANTLHKHISVRYADWELVVGEFLVGMLAEAHIPCVTQSYTCSQYIP